MGNALIGAAFISTEVMKKTSIISSMCQCPERGNLHFYLMQTILFKKQSKCVNALKGATFISTWYMRIQKMVFRCVNALKGATFISTKVYDDVEESDDLCQCPERGNLHFYKLLAHCNGAAFYECVNALKGATFISTTIWFRR